jgi:hypothetical protein
LFSFFSFWSLYPNIFYFFIFCILIFFEKGKIIADSIRKTNDFKNDTLKVERVKKKLEI